MTESVLDHEELENKELTVLEKSVLEFVRSRQFVSCVTLSKYFGAGLYNIEPTPGVIIAFGLSNTLSTALINLLNRIDILAFPCDPSVYLSWDVRFKLPIAKNVPAGGYKQRHWFPVTFCTGDVGIKTLTKINPSELQEVCADVGMIRSRGDQDRLMREIRRQSA